VEKTPRKRQDLRCAFTVVCRSELLLAIGCVPGKTLIKTARVYHCIKNGGSFGLPQPQVNPVDYRVKQGEGS
jgi:hypothetical protein